MSSLNEEVEVSIALPSAPPRFGSFTTKMSKTTEMKPSGGVTLSAHFQSSK